MNAVRWQGSALAWVMTRVPAGKPCSSRASTSISFSSRDSDFSSGTLFRKISTCDASLSLASWMKCLHHACHSGLSSRPLCAGNLSC